MKASRQRTLREAGFVGGSSWRVVRHVAVAIARTAAAAAVPAPSAMTLHMIFCTGIMFPRRFATNRLAPDHGVTEVSQIKRIR